MEEVATSPALSLSPTRPDALADRRTRQRLLEAAMLLLAERRTLTPGLLAEAAATVHCSPERAHLYFQRDEELILALYARFAAELEARVPELPTGTVAQRFRAAMEAKFALVAPYRQPLAALLATQLDPRGEMGVLSDRTEVVRRRVLGVFSAVVLGATDAPTDPTSAESLARALYGAHLALLLLWTQDTSSEETATRAALDLAVQLLELFGPGLSTPAMAEQLRKFDGTFGSLLLPAPDSATDALAEKILRLLFPHRRLLPSAGECAVAPCPQCLALHLPKVRRFVARNEPIHLLLPAFPAKSPSPKKVLGALPDQAEVNALHYLEAICDSIAAVYSPGARVTICSDGRVFSDLVGVTDANVTAYGDEIARLIAALGLRSLDTFSLEDLFEGDDFSLLRDQLVQHYAEPREAIEARTEAFPHHRSLFNGIHRFLTEEYQPTEPGMSKTRIREVCKGLTYEVIRRSDAWGRLLADCFPFALRLSIHPQDPHAEKIGILLSDAAEDAWITPWHGVAVLRPGGTFTLMKREDAEAIPGVRLICTSEGRPSHFVLPESTP